MDLIKCTSNTAAVCSIFSAPVLPHSISSACRRELREEVYRAFLTRASSGETNNAPIIESILALRQEQAKLLGYANYAEVSMASKVGVCPTLISLGGSATRFGPLER